MMLAQRDHRGHPFSTDDRELPSPPARAVDPDDRDPQDVLEEARTVADPEGELVTDGGESTDERVHAARINEQLAMDDTEPDDADEVAALTQQLRIAQEFDDAEAREPTPDDLETNYDSTCRLIVSGEGRGEWLRTTHAVKLEGCR